MPRYRIIQRASTLWTSFRGGILGCQKGVAFHAPPATWLKEAVSIWNPLENLSRLSLLRSWQTADFHNAAQIICNNITYLRDTVLNTVQFERCWKWVEALGVSFAAWGVLQTPSPILSGTLPLPQVTMAKNVRRAQKCAMTGCPQIYNPLILKVAKRDLWTYRSQLSNV